MPIVNNKYVSPTWNNDAPPALDATEMQAITNTVQNLQSDIVDATLLAASWTGSSAPYVYSLSVSGVTATSNQDIIPAVGITSEQLQALQGANIQDGGQSTGTIALKAWGIKPAVDIPIRVLKRGV